MKNVISFYPEMNEKAPEAVVGQAIIGHYGNWYIETPLTLKGRGITFLKKYQSNELTEKGQYKTGWNSYRVTDRALENLPYRFAREALLD
jgi:hypothetical protein